MGSRSPYGLSAAEFSGKGSSPVGSAYNPVLPTCFTTTMGPCLQALSHIQRMASRGAIDIIARNPRAFPVAPKLGHP
eukprot:9910762-Lingulodinium_polyedra.AAC.1